MIIGQWNNGTGGGDSNKWLWIKFQFVQEAVANQEGHCPRSSSATSKIPQLPAPDAAQAGSCFSQFGFFFNRTLFHIFERPATLPVVTIRGTQVCNFPNSRVASNLRGSVWLRRNNWWPIPTGDPCRYSAALKACMYEEVIITAQQWITELLWTSHSVWQNWSGSDSLVTWHSQKKTLLIYIIQTC